MLKSAVAPAASRCRVERRMDQRIAVSCNALLRLSATLTFRCLVRNLSRDAAQIVCNARYALLVPPSTAGCHRALEVSIALPSAAGVCAFTAACVVKYCVPDAGDRMALGIKFVDLERAERTKLESAIAAYETGVDRHH